MDTPHEILDRDYSVRFDELRKNRIVQSHYKYGWCSDTYPNGLADAVASLEKRLELYKQTGNAEWLVDVANFAMIEFMYPTHPSAHFRVTGSEESPGLLEKTGRTGISSKELMEGEPPCKRT